MDQVASELFDALPEAHKHMLNKYLGSFVPRRFRDVKFSLIDKENQDVVRGILADNNMGLFLSGPVGTGKTSLLYVVLKHHLLKRHLRLLNEQVGRPVTASEVYNQLQMLCQFVTHFELVKILRQYYSSGADDANEKPAVFYRPLVFIDDLGRGYDDQSGWNLALLDEYFDMRWRERRIVFVSTNKTPDELRNWPGWERIIDRLCDPSWMRTIVMKGKSRRRVCNDGK